MAESKLLVQGTPPPPLDREFTIVGKSINRLDGPEKVTGTAKYAGDIKLPGMLYGMILRSPYPRARIKRIDTTRAEALPGVHTVLSKENTKGWRTYWYRVPQIAFPECLTFEGHEVAAVAAVDAITAQEALARIEVEYEVLTPLLDAQEGLQKPVSPLVADEEYPGSETHDRKPLFIRWGDVARGFAEADIIVEDTYSTQIQFHGTIQTRACVADWDGQTLTLWDASQGIWNSREVLAKSLGLDPDNVRVIVKYLGGGFGSKAFCQRIANYASKLSMVTGRPVRIERSRREEFLAHPRRYSCRTSIKMGAKKDGTLTAVSQQAVVDVGATGRYYPIQIIWHTANLYACPNVELEQVGVYTNLQPTGPTRSPLNMTAIYFLETHMDKMAARLEMDPLQFRFKNYAYTSSLSADFAVTVNRTVFGGEKTIPYSSKNLDQCMKRTAEAIDWEKRRKSPDLSPGPVKRGMGMAAFLVFQGVGLLPYKAYADVAIHQDGTVDLSIGVVDIGGGQRTVFAMIAAEELGVGIDDINVIYGDTKGTRYTPSSHASRVTPEVGPAVLQAAAEARQKLFQIASAMLEVKAEDLRSKNGEIYLKSDPSRSIPFKSVCLRIDPVQPIEGRGSRSPNPNNPMFSTFGAQAVEVEVDEETGQIRIIRVVSAQDFGTAINPKFCTSQMYGGFVFGMGYALSEEGIYDPKTGKMLNRNFCHYGMPSAMDFPPMEALIIEGEDPYFAYSAKGAAENTNAPTPAAIVNAIYNASGIWMNDLPVTPDKVLKAIRDRKKKR